MERYAILSTLNAVSGEAKKDCRRPIKGFTFECLFFMVSKENYFTTRKGCASAINTERWFHRKRQGKKSNFSLPLRRAQQQSKMLNSLTLGRHHNFITSYNYSRKIWNGMEKVEINSKWKHRICFNKLGFVAGLELRVGIRSIFFYLSLFPCAEPLREWLRHWKTPRAHKIIKFIVEVGEHAGRVLSYETYCFVTIIYHHLSRTRLNWKQKFM